MRKLNRNNSNSLSEFHIIMLSHLGISLPLLLLGGCGSKEKPKVYDGLISSYIPPQSVYSPPEQVDQNFDLLNVAENEPYWVASLEMENSEEVINALLEEYENSFTYVFPKGRPNYEMPSISGWSPASSEMQTASRQIFSSLNNVLDIQFVESDSIDQFNAIAISSSFQTATSGFSYFPNKSYEIGSDVFIAIGYSSPIFISDTLTNYDYEVLVHEIGHALGLKHPFEPDRSNTSILNTFEDNTVLTAMSYNDSSESFSGLFRPLDLMTLTKFYGVNKSYNNGDNVYEFSENSGVFIIDGSGADTIQAENIKQDLYLDLREGAHSHVGSKSEHISSALQLTISHGTQIENAICGSGNDIVICNNLSNIISTNFGDDKIYLGAGADKINSGAGNDIIDFSEFNQEIDTLIIDALSLTAGSDLIYGFTLGSDGDIIDLTGIVDGPVSLLPVISSEMIPAGFITNHILRLVDEELNSSLQLEAVLNQGSKYANLRFSENSSIFIISSPSIDTGHDQYLFKVDVSDSVFEASQLATFYGNYLDIDNWSLDNFLSPNLEVLV